MNRFFATATLSALAVAASLYTGQSDAQSTNTALNACKSPPKLSGYTVLKITNATAAGNFAEVTFDKGSKHGVKEGQDAYLVNCDGERPWRGRAAFKITDVTKDGAKGKVGASLLSELKGAYAVVDTGYDSKSPAISGGFARGHEAMRILALQIQDNRAWFLLPRGTDDGIFPGDSGFVATRGYKKDNHQFVIERAGRKRAWASARMTLDMVKEGQDDILVAPSKKSCKSNAEDPDWSKYHGDNPRGWTRAAIKECTHFGNSGSMKIEKGLDFGVVPTSKVVLMDKDGISKIPAEVDQVGKSHAMVKVTWPNDVCADKNIFQVMVSTAKCD